MFDGQTVERPPLQKTEGIFGNNNNDGPQWNKTSEAVKRVENSGFYEEIPGGFFGKREKRFKGRFIIGRDTPINRGVYIGAGIREAIVVDDTKDRKLNEIYAELLKRRGEKENLLGEVWRLVREVMPYSEDRVDKICLALEKQDEKIYLSSFLGGGVCRHQALLTGYLLEQLSQAGAIRGRVSIDRNFVPGQGGHAWIRYVNSRGVVFIIDPAQGGYVGKLSEVPENGWFYKRPEDGDMIRKLATNVRRKFTNPLKNTPKKQPK